jgi:hypothetical protein
VHQVDQGLVLVRDDKGDLHALPPGSGTQAAGRPPFMPTLYRESHAAS